MKIDVHQHVWTDPLLEALAARESLPFVRCCDELTVLHCADEQPYVIDVRSEAPARRAALVAADGIDLALIAISSPVGIEGLARESACELIAAHLEGVAELGNRFAAWGPIALDRADPDDVDHLLARGCIGISLPAAALAGHDALDLVGPLLERISARRVPLLIHPGPGPGSRGGEAGLCEPLWWRALTGYVSQMQSAWLSLVSLGRRQHPELVAVFAMLAGGAPLLSERLHARGGPAIDVRDPLIYYDTSSYGPAAVEAMARHVGVRQLVYGSDRPVVEPTPTGHEALLKRNGARLLSSIGIPA